MIATPRPPALRQFQALLELWWKHLRRRARRAGEAPKLSGVPTFLVFQSVSIIYMTLYGWSLIERDIRGAEAVFPWHLGGVLASWFGLGLAAGAVRAIAHGSRNDSFLSTLPLATSARLGLRLVDHVGVLPISLGVVVACFSARGALSWACLPAVLLGWIAFPACFVAGYALGVSARALGRASIARAAQYAGLTIAVAGAIAVQAPLRIVMKGPPNPVAERIANLWVGIDSALFELYLAFLALGFVSYALLAAVERRGIDQIDAESRPPKLTGFRERHTLERTLIARRGGGVFLLLWLQLAIVAGACTAAVAGRARLAPFSMISFYAATVICSLGAWQALFQASQAARGDASARAFLATLPLSPQQVLSGKTGALRAGLWPVLSLLSLLGLSCAWRADFLHAARILLGIWALYGFVAGAISIAYLSSSAAGVGVSSGFSTQLLLLPMLTLFTAPTLWAATRAGIAVLAVSREARRAAVLSVRWCDDASEDLERDTSVWRALLAAAAFFSVQGFSYALWAMFDIASGYRLALTYAASALVLGLLSARKHERIATAHWVPARLWYAPLGVLAGAASGLLSVVVMNHLAGASSVTWSRGEWLAVFSVSVAIAPLVEEWFFRGWLQRAIAAELPSDKRGWAVALGAVAFALAHFQSVGLSQLLLGMIAGALFARSSALGPGILAHAAHNAVVLLLAR